MSTLFLTLVVTSHPTEIVLTTNNTYMYIRALHAHIRYCTYVVSIRDNMTFAVYPKSNRQYHRCSQTRLFTNSL